MQKCFYGAFARSAYSWENFHSTFETLKSLAYQLSLHVEAQQLKIVNASTLMHATGNLDSYVL